MHWCIVRTFHFSDVKTGLKNTLLHCSSHISLLFVTLGEAGPAYQSHRYSYVPTFSHLSSGFLYLTSLRCDVAMRNADGGQGSDFPLKDRSNKLSLFLVLFLWLIRSIRPRNQHEFLIKRPRLLKGKNA